MWLICMYAISRSTLSRSNRWRRSKRSIRESKRIIWKVWVYFPVNNPRLATGALTINEDVNFSGRLPSYDQDRNFRRSACCTTLHGDLCCSWYMKSCDTPDGWSIRRRLPWVILVWPLCWVRGPWWKKIFSEEPTFLCALYPNHVEL